VEYDALRFSREPGLMTSVGRFDQRLDLLPREVAGLVSLIQGLLVHKYAAPAYGVSVPPERDDKSHLRTADAMLETLLARDGRLPELRALYQSDDRLRVPATVFNAVRGPAEAL
jgi:hypothetical protein